MKNLQQILSKHLQKEYKYIKDVKKFNQISKFILNLKSTQKGYINHSEDSVYILQNDINNLFKNSASNTVFKGLIELTNDKFSYGKSTLKNYTRTYKRSDKLVSILKLVKAEYLLGSCSIKELKDFTDANDNILTISAKKFMKLAVPSMARILKAQHVVHDGTIYINNHISSSFYGKGREFTILNTLKKTERNKIAYRYEVDINNAQATVIQQLYLGGVDMKSLPANWESIAKAKFPYMERFKNKLYIKSCAKKYNLEYSVFKSVLISIYNAAERRQVKYRWKTLTGTELPYVLSQLISELDEIIKTVLIDTEYNAKALHIMIKRSCTKNSRSQYVSRLYQYNERRIRKIMMKVLKSNQQIHDAVLTGLYIPNMMQNFVDTIKKATGFDLTFSFEIINKSRKPLL